MSHLKKLSIGLIILILFLISEICFVVSELETAVRFQFGQVVDTYDKPGLKFKLPFIQKVMKFDKRIQTLETDKELFLTFEKKNLMVDTFAKWRITDPKQFYTVSKGSVEVANRLLAQNIKDGLRSEFGKKSLQEVVSGFDGQKQLTTRQEIQDTITQSAKSYSQKLGIDVIDIRIKGVELPDGVMLSVFKRMSEERNRIATEFRARGEASYTEIKAQANKKATVMLAEAYGKAEKIRGEGDSKAATIYSEAYNKDKDFYEFYRSLQAYRQVFTSKSDILVLNSNSPFFKFFQLDAHK